MNAHAELAHHGGALDAAKRLFPRAPEPWLDLSTGINAVPYQLPVLPPEAWTRLPEAEDLAALERAAAARYQMPIGANVVAAPGSQALIGRLPALYGGCDVRVLGRTYGEYERVFREAEARVRCVPHVEALAGADVAIVVNPNNPDGRLVPPEALALLSRRVGRLVVDEAFMDAMPPAHSLVPRLPPARAIVLRSFGKIYGLAGLRLGFAVAPAGDGAALRRMLGPWAVSGPALAIGRAALADDMWIDATRARLRSDGARLGFLMNHIGAEFLGGTPLFRLFAHPAAPNLFSALARRGILTRPFADEPRRLRLGLPGSESDWARLQDALLAFR